MMILRNIAFYLIFYGGSLFYVLGSLAALVLGRNALIFVAAGWSTWHRICVTTLLGIRIKVEGELPGEGFLVALKHESFFEAIDLPNLLGRPGVIAKAELLRIPLWGQAARGYGLIAVERDQGAKALRAMITGARGLIAEGRSLAIFPEGTRVPHGREAPLQSGFAGLYKLLGLPVVPIAVDSGPLYHRRWKRRGTITYRVGEVIPTGLPREEIEARVLSAINVLNTEAAARRA
jgi:1-acyl-sn-glycerol-3-phosphate acyltransferase